MNANPKRISTPLRVGLIIGIIAVLHSGATAVPVVVGSDSGNNSPALADASPRMVLTIAEAVALLRNTTTGPSVIGFGPTLGLGGFAGVGSTATGATTIPGGIGTLSAPSIIGSGASTGFVGGTAPVVVGSLVGTPVTSVILNPSPLPLPPVAPGIGAPANNVPGPNGNPATIGPAAITTASTDAVAPVVLSTPAPTGAGPVVTPDSNVPPGVVSSGITALDNVAPVNDTVTSPGIINPTVGNLDVAVVPETGSCLLLLSIGLTTLTAVRRRLVSLA